MISAESPFFVVNCTFYNIFWLRNLFFTIIFSSIFIFINCNFCLFFRIWVKKAFDLAKKSGSASRVPSDLLFHKTDERSQQRLAQRCCPPSTTPPATQRFAVWRGEKGGSAPLQKSSLDSKKPWWLFWSRHNCPPNRWCGLLSSSASSSSFSSPPAPPSSSSSATVTSMKSPDSTWWVFRLLLEEQVSASINV